MKRISVRAGKVREQAFGAVDHIAAVMGSLLTSSKRGEYNEIIIPEGL